MNLEDNKNKEKIYSEKDLISIINFLNQGYELNKSKTLALQQDPLIHLISESVMDHFDIKTLIPRSRKTEDIVPMVVFFYLILKLLPYILRVYEFQE